MQKQAHSIELLARAIEAGDVESVRAVLDLVDVNSEIERHGVGYQPLHRAAARGHAHVAELLLGRGAQ